MWAELEAYLLADEDHRRAAAEDLLRQPGAREQVLRKIRVLQPGSKARDTYWRLACHDAAAAIAAQDDGWPDRVVTWLIKGEATWQESANLCADTGFQAYLLDRPDPVTTAMIREADPTTTAGRALLHLHLVALRLAYQWENMAQCLADLGTPLADLDPYSRAYHVFALLVQGRPEALPEMDALLADGGEDYRVHLSLVEGLRLSRSIPGQGELMLKLLDRPALRDSASPDPLYRRAYALRKLGRHEEALRTVDECLQRISPLQVRDRIRIIQERDLILAEQAIARQSAAATEAAQAQLRQATAQLEALMAQQIEEVRRTAADGLFRVVEILGLFTALIALLGGSVASAVAQGLSWWQRGLLILIAAIVALGFFLVLRVLVRPRPRGGPRSRPR
ncbi:hypothetical protein [Longispora albida]|uniref:hypothetical protein n=1 Tax=Longispora albida TaxID=203523 RepID=UPI0003711166|nr:hypothetical protein [Longispora albida]